MKKSKCRSKTQGDKFVRKAHELGADDGEAAFERKLKRIVPKKPKEKAPKS